MREDTTLRFNLAHQLMEMPYGNSRVLPRDLVMSAWPPTGDHDRSIEGAFHAMALANGGHRPEASYTTEERIHGDLDESFRVEQDPFSGDYAFHRNLRDCPRCRGAGVIREIPLSAIDQKVRPAAIDEMTTVNLITRPCDHKPD